MPSPGADPELEAYFREYAQRIPSMLAAIEEQWSRFVSGDAGAARELHRKLHSLAGSAGTFGFGQLGLRAQALEFALEPLLDGGPPGSAGIEALSALLANLKAAAPG